MVLIHYSLLIIHLFCLFLLTNGFSGCIFVSSCSKFVFAYRRSRAWFFEYDDCGAQQRRNSETRQGKSPLVFCWRQKQTILRSVSNIEIPNSLFRFFAFCFCFSGGAVPFSDVFTSSEGVMDIWFDRQSTLGFMRWNPEPRTRIKCVVSFKNRYPPPERTILFPRSLPEPTKHGAGGLPVGVPYI